MTKFAHNSPAGLPARGPDRTEPPAGPARRPRLLPTGLVLGLTVTGLLGVIGAAATLLPGSVTGTGLAPEHPVALVGPAPKVAPGGGTAGPGAATGSSSTGAAPPHAAPAPPHAAPASSRAAARKTRAAPGNPKPTHKPATRPRPRRPAAGPGQAAQEAEVIRLVNVERRRAGCGPVRLNARLRTAMRLHVQELGRHGNLYLNHVSDDGRTFADRARAQGYTQPGGENIARGQRSAAAVMDGWMHSSGHRANILNCRFRAIGVGRAMGVDGTLVWGQLFGFR